MIKRLQFSLILMFFTFALKGQTIGISQIQGEKQSSVCLGQKMLLAYSKTGTFNQDNTFKVQFKPSYSETWITLETKDSSGYLVADLSNQLNSILNVSNSVFCFFRIISSSPSYISTNYNTDIYVNASVDLLSIKKKILYPYEAVSINVKTTGSSPIYLLTSDSTNIKVDNYNNSTQDISISPSRTGKYSILGVTNICGVGKSSGSADITIIDNTLKLLNIPQSSVCKNSKLNLNVLQSGKWPTDIKYTIRLTEYYSSSRSYDFEATVDGDICSCNIGNAIATSSYRAKVIASNGVESDFYEHPIYVSNESKAEFKTTNTSIKYGQSQYLEVVASGYGPYSLELSDGQIYVDPDGVYGRTIYFPVSPKETTQYSIKNFSTGCGNTIGTNTVVLTIQGKSIKTDLLKEGRYCEGATCEVKVTSNADLKIGSIVKVRLSNSSSLGYGAYKDSEGTVIRENVVLFTIPKGLRTAFDNPFVYASVFTDEIEGTTMSPNAITITSLPSGSFNINDTGTTINIKNPQEVYLSLTLKGGGPYGITTSDGTKQKLEYYSDYYFPWETNTGAPIYVSKTSTLSVTSISNECGINTQTSALSKQVIVEDPQYAIQLTSEKYEKSEICVGEKIDLSLNVTGQYGDSNQFNLELLNDMESVIKNLGIVTPGNLQATIPLDLPSGSYSLRVTATNPLIYSGKFNIFIRTLPTIGLSSNNVNMENLIDGRMINFTLGINGGGINYVTFKDGTKEIYNTEHGKYYINDSKEVLKTTTFGIQSVSNICGVGTVVTKDFTIIVKPFKIENLINTNSYIYCLNSKLIVPFEVKGYRNNDTRFSVQIAIGTDTTYTTLETGIKESPAIITIPNTYKTGSYNIRIISSSDNSIKSNAVSVMFRSTSNHVLQLSGGGNSAQIDAGNSISLRSEALQDYSGLPIRYVINDDKNYKTIGSNNYNYFEVSKSPVINTTYKLVSAINSCGVGSVSGTVKITVNPVLDMNIRANNNRNICIGSNVGISLNSVGAFEANNTFKVYAINENNVQKEVLNVSKNGEYVISFGNDFQKGTYKLRLESSNPYQSKDIANVFLTTKPDVTLMGGAIINQGMYAYLMLKSNDSYIPKGNIYSDPVTYELSNGTTGSLYLYALQPLISVNPTKTETYTLKSITNVCGAGKADGIATITVNPPSTKQINFIESLTNFCVGSTLNIYFFTSGQFSSNNKFTVQLSDKTGKNFRDLETTGNTSPLKVKIPADITPELGYYMRVVSSDNDATSSTNTSGLTVLPGISARFDTASYAFSTNKPVSIKVKFVGTPPFNFNLGSDEISAKTFTSSVNDYILTVNPIASTSYRLFSVNNQVCGLGTILSPSTVKLELITAIDELGKLGINVFPNPTSDVINIESDSKDLDVQLIDFSGKVVYEEKLKGEQKQLDLSKISSGTYFLHIQKEDKQVVFKLLKL